MSYKFTQNVDGTWALVNNITGTSVMTFDSADAVSFVSAGLLGMSRGTLAATGTGASTAAVITKQVTAVTASDGTKAVALPAAAVTSGPLLVINTVTTATLPVFPVNGGNDNINAGAEDAAWTLGAGKAAWFIPTSATQWYVEDMSAVTSTTTELNYVDVTTIGTVQASKAVVVDSNKDASAFRNVTVTNLDAGASGTAGSVDVFPAGATSGKLSLTAANSAGDTATTIVNASQAGVRTYTIPDAGASASFAMTEGAQTFNGVQSFPGNIMATEAGAGITGGVGTIYKSSVIKEGGIIRTSILIDLTGLGSSTTDLDIIGQGVSVAHIGQITAARNGTILSGRITCLEAPATGVTDIDLYSATEGTGVFDGAVGDLTETAILTSGAAWTLGRMVPIGAVPAANEYLYLTCGAGGTPATYTAGKFLIELEGY